MKTMFGFPSDKVVVTALGLFASIVAFDGERALVKLDEVYTATQANSTQIGINKAELATLTASKDDHETRIRVLEREDPPPSKKPTSVPIGWQPFTKPEDPFASITKF